MSEGMMGRWREQRAQAVKLDAAIEKNLLELGFGD